MRYIISQTQFHKLIYSYLEKQFTQKDFRKEINPYVKDGNTWRIDMFNDKKRNVISFFWYGPGEDDDGNRHNGVGYLQVHPDIIDTLRGAFTVRESKILDVIADWVTETLDVDVDEIEIYPERKKIPNY